MKIAKKHGPTLSLVIMVSIMVFVMSLFFGFLNGAFADGFLRVWPRQFLIALLVAMPAAFVARALASAAVAKLTE
ncbi:MAG: DUF2798 domain-containing protein [Candidatus Thermoplasmatota archaeon]